MVLVVSDPAAVKIRVNGQDMGFLSCLDGDKKFAALCSADRIESRICSSVLAGSAGGYCSV